VTPATGTRRSRDSDGPPPPPGRSRRSGDRGLNCTPDTGVFTAAFWNVFRREAGIGWCPEEYRSRQLAQLAVAGKRVVPVPVRSYDSQTDQLIR
jgi:hypothetical protein